MTTKKELQAFQNMWTWLSSHPAHDQEYYMKYVAKLDTPWKDSCPLCHTAEGLCSNCEILWRSKAGGLCADKNSPLNKWRQTSTDDSDNRTWYASKIALLGRKAEKSLSN